MGLILGVAFLLTVLLAVSAGLATLGGYLGDLLPGQEALLQVLNIAVSIAVVSMVFGMIFKWMLTARGAWRDVWVGALVTACLFEVGKVGIGVYLGKSGLSESFAGAGALVILLAWVYYAAQIFLLGAEFTKVYAGRNSAPQNQTAAAQDEQAGRQVPTKSGTDVVQPPVAVANAMTAAESASTQDVRQRLVRASADLLPRLVLLGAMALLRVAINTRVKQEERLVRAARTRRALR